MISFPVNEFVLVNGDGAGHIPDVKLTYTPDKQQLTLKCNKDAQAGDGMFWALRYHLNKLDCLETDTQYDIFFSIAFAESAHDQFVLIRAFNGEYANQIEVDKDGTYGVQISQSANSNDFYIDVLTCEWASIYLKEGQELTISNISVVPKVKQYWKNTDDRQFVVVNNCSLFDHLLWKEAGRYKLAPRDQATQLDISFTDTATNEGKYYCDVTGLLYLESDFPIKGHVRFSDGNQKASETYEINLPAGRWPIYLSLRSQHSADYSFMLSFKPGGAIDIEIDSIQETRIPFPMGSRLKTDREPSTALSAYLSHHRNGSSWLYSILHTLSAISDKRVSVAHYLNENYDKITDILAENGTELLVDRNIDLGKYNDTYLKGIHIIRDPRDMLVSSYFSHLKSHPDDGWPELTNHRILNQKLSQENGLIEEINFCGQFFKHMYSVKKYEHKHDILTIKFEDLIARQTEIFETILAHLEINLCEFPDNTLTAILEQHEFQKMSEGRKEGEENTDHHYRKGIAGDWKNYFTNPIKEVFKAKHQELLTLYDYETDESW